MGDIGCPSPCITFFLGQNYPLMNFLILTPYLCLCQHVPVHKFEAHTQLNFLGKWPPNKMKRHQQISPNRAMPCQPYIVLPWLGEVRRASARVCGERSCIQTLCDIC